jgi:nicotinate-nucleotide adenylyltransferase
MKIGLYFGSFNPIHTGHLIIASHIVEHTDLQKIWFVVSPQNPLKPSATLLNEYQRLNMVRLAVENDIRFNASDVEFKLPKPSYTIDTLTYLSEKYPKHQFTVIMGGDSYQNLSKWKNYELLVKDYSIIVYNRLGFELKENPYNSTILNAPLLDISSTLIRNLIKAKKSIKYLVTDAVFDELMNNKYYK